MGEGNVQDDGRREALGRNDTETVMRRGHKRQMQRQQVEEKYTQGRKKMEIDTGIQSDTEREAASTTGQREDKGRKRGRKKRARQKQFSKMNTRGKERGDVEKMGGDAG